MQIDIGRLLHHHFGVSSYQADHDLQQLLNLVKPYLTSTSKVLDLGCGVGRLAFELAKTSWTC